jgi:antitoxin (DNA-binding transcriptional repressor) of toxin-antitoxin stability system
MSSHSIAKAKDNLSKLIDEALAGEEVTITRHGKPVVELAAGAHGRRRRALVARTH